MKWTRLFQIFGEYTVMKYGCGPMTAMNSIEGVTSEWYCFLFGQSLYLTENK
jgi:hypothetical protein